MKEYTWSCWNKPDLPALPDTTAASVKSAEAILKLKKLALCLPHLNRDWRIAP
jgi:hypothetical protein